MPYTTSQSDGKVTVSKKVGGHSKVVGHTTPGKKKAYLAALHIHEPKKEGMEAPGPGYDNQIGDIYAVQKPITHDCAHTDLIQKVDPMTGIASVGMEPNAVYGLYPDEETAMQIAEKIHKEFVDAAEMLEEKKHKVAEKIKKVMTQMEKARNESMKMIKENPMEASAHRDKVAEYTHKIDELVQKLERIEKAKKEIKKDEDKKEK
jgi:uncharacterized protein (UPF0335 family)